MNRFTKSESELTRLDTMSTSGYVRVVVGGSSRSISLSNLASLVNELATTTYSVTTSTTNYIATNSTDTLLMDLTNGALSVILPEPGISEGKIISIKKIDDTTNDLTVQSTSGDIDGSSTATLSGSGGAKPSASFVSDGSNWYILNA